MSAAWSFVAGWISASLFILVGMLLQRRRRVHRQHFATTTQWLEETAEVAPLQRIGNRWYPPVATTSPRAS